MDGKFYNLRISHRYSNERCYAFRQKEPLEKEIHKNEMQKEHHIGVPGGNDDNAPVYRL